MSMKTIDPALVPGGRNRMRSASPLFWMPLVLLAAACRTVHEPTVQPEAPPRTAPGTAALPAERSFPLPAEALAEIPMSSTGIVLLRPPVPGVPVDSGGLAGAAEPGGAGEPDVVILREAWPNPVARGGVRAAEVGFRMDAVRFAYDSADPDFAARQAVSRYAAWMKDHPEVHLTLEGHCDERGSSDYNYNLAMARAWTVKDLLVGLGVEPGRLFTISYGEEQPIALGGTPQAHALNRRVEFRPFYPARDGHLLSTLRDDAPGLPEGERGVPPPQPALELGPEAASWPPLAEEARP